MKAQMSQNQKKNRFDALSEWYFMTGTEEEEKENYSNR